MVAVMDLLMIIALNFRDLLLLQLHLLLHLTLPAGHLRVLVQGALLRRVLLGPRLLDALGPALLTPLLRSTLHGLRDLCVQVVHQNQEEISPVLHDRPVDDAVLGLLLHP